jgi:hypothetical protein
MKQLGSFIRTLVGKEIVPVGNNFSCADGADAAILSPKTILAAATQLITVPTNAAEVVINCDDDVQICKNADFTEYDRLPAGIPTTIQTGKLDSLYLKNANAASIVVYFRFVTL